MPFGRSASVLLLMTAASQAGAQPVPPRPPAHAVPPAHAAPPDHAVSPAAAHKDAPARPAAHAPAHPATHPSHPGRPHSAHPAPVPAAPPAASAPASLPPEQPSKGSNTGLPLPRFVSLRSETVNFRAGPGRQYPIEWVYQRRDLPVEIEREFENWRLVEDREGVKGWVHQAILAPRRTGVVVGGEHELRSAARDDASAVARLKVGVVIRLRACVAGADWCQASIGDYRGWIRRTDVWGLLPNEEVQ